MRGFSLGNFRKFLLSKSSPEREVTLKGEGKRGFNHPCTLLSVAKFSDEIISRARGLTRYFINGFIDIHFLRHNS